MARSNRPQGPMHPEKYPNGFVGKNYIGEQPGYIYDPYKDGYRVNPKEQQQYYEQSGLVEPEPKAPSIYSQLGPLFGAGLTLAGAQSFGKELPGMFGVGKDAANAGKAGQSINQEISSNVLSSPVNSAQQANASPGFWNNLWGSSPSSGASAPGAATADAPYGVGTYGGQAVSTNAAPELGGMQSLGSVPGGLLNLAGSGLAGAGAAAGIVGGTALLGKGLYDTYKGNNDKSPVGLASRLQAGITTGGLSELARFGRNLFGDGDKWKTEGNKLNSLKDSGTFVPDELINTLPTKGRSKDQLINKDLPADFIGRDSNGNWVNNKWLHTHDYADLRPEDIVNYAAFADRDPEWYRKPMDERLKVADQYLKAGAVSEGKGSIKLDDKKVQSAPVLGTPRDAGNGTGQPAPTPSKGTRLSPGIYADGKGGSYKK